MNYLERNAQVISEIQSGFKIKRKGIVGKSAKTIVTSVGSYPSKVFGGELPVAIKEISDLNPDYWMRGIFDLAFLNTISNRIPELIPEIPFFHGLIQDTQGNYQGFITEDLSQGGSLKLQELVEGDVIRNDPLIDSLRKLLSGSMIRYPNEDLANMFFYCSDDEQSTRRIGDIDKAKYCLSPKEIEERFPFEEIIANLENHTVVVDYSF